jgi:hypothetical protein
MTNVELEAYRGITNHLQGKSSAERHQPYHLQSTRRTPVKKPTDNETHIREPAQQN